MSPLEIEILVQRAHLAAKRACENQEMKFALEDRMDCCGFAWVEIYKFEGKKIRANSKLGKALIEKGITKSYTGGYTMWNPARVGTQNLSSLEEGARAAVQIFEQAGFLAFASSRMD